MEHVFVVLVATFIRWFHRHRAWALLCLASLLCACSVVGGASTLPALIVPKDRVHEVCWKPSKPDAATDVIDDDGDGAYFVFDDFEGPAISSKQRDAFGRGVRAGGFIYKYVESAPIANLLFLPLNQTDAWCTRIPRPTDEKVLELLNPSAEPTATAESLSVEKNLLAQAESPPLRSALFCGKQPQMAPTTAESILTFRRNIAYQQSYEYARNTAMALTLANAQIEEVRNRGSSWLKRTFTSDPGRVEEIQQRLADQLNSIEEPPVYCDPILEDIALLGFNIGFDNGTFEVKAKLFAIDVGVMLVELVALEVALGPLGGAKFLASAVSRGTKVLTAAVSRLKDIPIFIPGAAGGAGGVIRVGNVLKAMSKYHSEKLEAAMFAEAELLKKPLVKLATDETHHIVAHGSNRPFAKECRDILDKFGIGLDNAANGVFLPATKKSPNPKGSIVHKILGSNDKYYERMHDYLKKATSPADALQRLRRMGEALEKGTFFNAPL